MEPKDNEKFLQGDYVTFDSKDCCKCGKIMDIDKDCIATVKVIGAKSDETQKRKLDSLMHDQVQALYLNDLGFQPISKENAYGNTSIEWEKQEFSWKWHLKYVNKEDDPNNLTWTHSVQGNQNGYPINEEFTKIVWMHQITRKLKELRTKWMQ